MAVKKQYVGGIRKSISKQPLKPTGLTVTKQPSLRERATSFVGRGLSNFQENMAARGGGPGLLDDVGAGLSNFNRAPTQRKSRSRKSDYGSDYGMPSFSGSSGLDLSMHPDPFYRNLGRGRGGSGEGRRKKVVRTVTTYED